MAATPKVITDNSSDLDEANLNLFLNALKLQVKINYCSLVFTASSNTPTIDTGRANGGEIVDGDLSWDSGNNEIDVTLSGFSTTPLVFATIHSNGSTNADEIRAAGTSSTAAFIRFTASGGNAGVDPDGNMQISVMFLGY